MFGNRLSESEICFFDRDGPGIPVVTARLKKVSSKERTRGQTGQPWPDRPLMIVRTSE
jgi:hypothetical protein